MTLSAILEFARTAGDFFVKWKSQIIIVLLVFVQFSAGVFVTANYYKVIVSDMEAKVQKVESSGLRQVVDEAKIINKETAVEVVVSAAKSSEIERKVVIIREQAQKLQLAATEFTASGVTFSQLCSTNKGENRDETPVSLDAISLSNGTVSVLNNARNPREGFDPSAIGDAEGRAASGVTVTDLVRSDIDIATRYNVLATRHNELVDFVNEKMQQQAE